jgi:hypothetical protein
MSSPFGEDKARDSTDCDGFSDGGTGGTSSKRRDNNPWANLCDSSTRLSISCVENRDADSAASRRVLTGDKCLKPKLHRVRRCEAEMEALMKASSRIGKRLPKEEGKSVPLPVALEAGVSRFSDIELVRRLRLHEESLAGVPERLVSQACARVMSNCSGDGCPGGHVERPVELADVKANYVYLLSSVDSLVQENIAKLQEEVNQLNNEVQEIDDFMSICFDKMDQDATGSINSEMFVDFLCEQDLTLEGAIHISPQDAESFFMQMSHGQVEIGYDQFKDEITSGCLHAMQTNMNLRQHMQKRCRDFWF